MTESVKQNRIAVDFASKIHSARFSLADPEVRKQRAKQPGVSVSAYGAKQHPRGKKSKASEFLDSLESSLSRSIEASLDLKSFVQPAGSEKIVLLATCQFAAQLESELQRIFESYVEWLYEILRTSIFLSVHVPRFEEPDFDEYSEAQQVWMIEEFRRKQKSDVNDQQRGRVEAARLLTHELLYEKLKLPHFGSVGEPILPQHVINAYEVSVLSLYVNVRAAEKSAAVAKAMVQLIRNGFAESLFFELDGLGQHAQKFSYPNHHIEDALQKQSVNEVDVVNRWRRTTKTIVVEQTLVLGELYPHESMLGNPSLPIPLNYRGVIEKCPAVLASSLTGLFGTQTGETESLRGKSSTTVETRWRSRFVPDDPCILLGNTIVFTGWGDTHMQANENHQTIVDTQRRLLDKASGYSGQLTAYSLSATIVFIAFMIQAIVLVSSDAILLAVVAGLPLVVVLGVLVSSAAHARERMKSIRAVEEVTTSTALEELEERYPGIDASFPGLVSEEAKR